MLANIPFALNHSFNSSTATGGESVKSVIRGAHEIAPGLLQVECRSWPLAWWECQCWFVLTPPVSIQSGAGCILLCSPTSIATVASSPLSTRPSCSLQRFSVLGPSIWIVFGIGANNHAAIFSKIAGGLPSIAETELDDLLWHQWCQDRLYQLLDLQWGNGGQIKILEIERNGIQWPSV